MTTPPGDDRPPPDVTKTIDPAAGSPAGAGHGPDGAGRGPGGSGRPGLPTTAIDLPPGTRIGHFRIERHLGEGGAGSVFVAEDLDIPGRRVALKLIQAGGITADIEALRREASALAALQHPNILVVHEIGASEAGPYLVTELLARGSLAARLRGGPLPLDEALAVGRRITSALAAAHAAGLLHRDIKPANILIAADGTVKVADFGLAWRTVPAAEPASGPSSAGLNPGAPLSAGTPHYIAPETLEGAEPGAAADQFACAVTLHELLTGRRPFAGSDWRRAALSGDAEVDRTLPSDVAAILRRALARRQEDRFASMAVMAAAVEAAAQRRDPRRRRYRMALAGAAALVVVLVGGFFLSRFLSTRTAHRLNEKGRAALLSDDRDAARRDFLAAHAADTGYLPACANLGALAAAESNPTWAISILEECAAAFPDAASVRYNLGATLRRTGNVARAEPVLRETLTLAADGPIRPLALNELALLLLDAGRGQEAVTLLEAAPAPDAASMEAAVLDKTLGLALLAVGRADEAVTHFRSALAMPLSPEQRGAALAGLGRALEVRHDPLGAIEAYSQGLLAGADPATEQAMRDGLERLAAAGVGQDPPAPRH